MNDTTHTYEAKIWRYGDGWKALVLRNGVLWSLEHDFDTHESALEWAKAEAEADRVAVDAERQAERIPV